MHRWTDTDDDGLVTARVGWESDDLPELKPGVSVVWGKAVGGAHGGMAGPRMRRELAALDLTWTAGSGVLRAEGSAGRRDGEPFQGGFAGVDFSLLGWLELNADWAVRSGWRGGPAAGVTLDVLGAKVRAAYRYPIEKEDEDEVTGQVYYSWSRSR